MEKHYFLGEVAKLVGRKPHQIVHLLTTGKIPEPAAADFQQATIHEADVPAGSAFPGGAKWAAMESTPMAVKVTASQGLVLRPPYEVVQVSEIGHEVRDGDGEIFAWAPDRAKGTDPGGAAGGSDSGLSGNQEDKYKSWTPWLVRSTASIVIIERLYNVYT